MAKPASTTLPLPVSQEGPSYCGVLYDKQCCSLCSECRTQCTLFNIVLHSTRLLLIAAYEHRRFGGMF